VQSESRVLEEKQAKGEPAVRLPCKPATPQISNTCVPHCPSTKWKLREQSEETLEPFSRAFAGEEEGTEVGAWALKRMA